MVTTTRPCILLNKNKTSKGRMGISGFEKKWRATLESKRNDEITSLGIVLFCVLQRKRKNSMVRILCTYSIKNKAEIKNNIHEYWRWRVVRVRCETSCLYFCFFCD